MMEECLTPAPGPCAGLGLDMAMEELIMSRFLLEFISSLLYRPISGMSSISIHPTVIRFVVINNFSSRLINSYVHIGLDRLTATDKQDHPHSYTKSPAHLKQTIQLGRLCFERIVNIFVTLPHLSKSKYLFSQTRCFTHFKDLEERLLTLIIYQSTSESFLNLQNKAL